MLPTFLALSAVSALSAAGPGLGTRVSESVPAYAEVDGLRVSVAPLYLGWTVAEGVPVEIPSRYGVAAVGLRVDDWLEARIVELAVVDTKSLRAKSFYLHPVSVSATRDRVLVPGWLALSGRLDLTLSLWQSTHAVGARDETPPFLLCASGSIAQGLVSFVLRHELSLSVVAGVGDDPVHFDDGAECLGGGPVWQSSRWLGARVELQVGRGVSVGAELGRAERGLHEVAFHEHEHAGGALPAHEHVAVRSVEGLESGAWLAAAF